MGNLNNDIDEKNYDRAILLIQNQVQLLWLVFGAFLITVTVVLAGIVSIIQEGQSLLIFFIAIFGFIVCVLWWGSFRYNYAFYLLRINEAKKIEPSLSNCSFFKNGEDLSNGKEVEKVSIPFHALPPKIAISILILLFAFTFFILAIIYGPFYNY